MGVKSFSFITLFLIIVAFAWKPAAAAKPEASPELLRLGEKAYERECRVCHGQKGEGDGEAAYLLFPKPRNITSGTFKVRSTPSGEPPTDADLFHTVAQGLPGSAMPGFSHLPERERWGLVYYVKKLASIDRAPESVITVPPAALPTMDSRAAGRKLYRDLKCWECHGGEGRGDGPSSLTARDDWGYPAPPNDFTRGIYKGGGEDKDIYLRFTTGMDGTPMPSYESSASEEGRWALVHYVKSLAGPKKVVQPSAGEIPVKKVAGELPAHPVSAAWDSVKGVTVPVMLLWQRQKVTDHIVVKAVHNGESITFLLQWEDDAPNSSFIRTQDFSDGAALQFALTQEKSRFTMGDKGKPVNIWLWKADRQLDLARFRDMEDVYPGMAGDDYQLARGWYPKTIEGPGHVAMASAPAHDRLFLAGWGAGNPMSDPWRSTAVEDLNAEGFSTLTTQPPENQNVKGSGFWVNGYWLVQFTRRLNSNDPNDARFVPGGKAPIAFAVWDGNRGDRDGQKSVSTWYTINIEK